MDLLPLRKKLITIPTPGQPEQQYLAEYLHKKNMLLYFRQADFNLTTALATAANFDYRFVQYDTSMFRECLHALVSELHEAQKKLRVSSPTRSS